MPNHGQFTIESQRQNIDHINVRWSQLYHLEKEWADKAVDYLFLVNSGGAIAMLGFIGARPKVSFWVIVGLGLMLLGLILVGFLKARIYHQMSSLFKLWRKDVRDYLANNISWEKLNKDDDERAKQSLLVLFLGYGSLGCFILGILIGILGVLK